MAYQINEGAIRQKVRNILKEKIKDPLYDGRGYNEKMNDRVRGILTKVVKENKKSVMGGYGMTNYYMKPPQRGGKNTKRVYSGRKNARKNPWIQFFMKFRRSHPNLEAKEAMRQAAVAYRKRKNKKSRY